MPRYVPPMNRLVIIPLVLLASGCGGGSEKAATAALPCVTVPADLVTALASGVDDGKPALKLTDTFAVKSKEHNDIYMIGAWINGDTSQPGVWAKADGLHVGGGLTTSVTLAAQQQSVWPDGTKKPFSISIYEDGVMAVERCVKAGHA